MEGGHKPFYVKFRPLSLPYISLPTQTQIKIIQINKLNHTKLTDFYYCVV